METILELIEAKTPKEKEKIYRLLEKVGMDRMTAKIVAAEIKKEMDSDVRTE